MKILLFVAVVLLTLSGCQAAQKRKVSKRLPGKKQPSSLAGELNLGGRSGFKLGPKARTAKGHERQQLRQMLDGVEVVGAVADVEVTEEGLMTGGVSGTVAYSLEGDIPDAKACRRSPNVLTARVLKYLRDNHLLSINDYTPPRNVKAEKKIYMEGEEGVARLVYQVVFLLEISPTPTRPFFLLDACSPQLDVILHFDKIQNASRSGLGGNSKGGKSKTTTLSPFACPSTAPANGLGGNLKAGLTTYGVELPFCLYTQVSGNTCTFSSKYAVVIDMEFGDSAVGKSALQFNCEQGHSDPINGAYGVANDAFYFGDSTGALYEQWYGLYALGYAPQLRVHYRTCYENAFWNGRDLTFGDGCNYLYPLVSQDVVAHELGHGITDRFSDLYYSEQSGGINEAFSDMSGEVAEMFSRNSNDWEVGRELFKSDRALRYFQTPSRDGASIDYAYQFTPGMDVHYSSGVFNRAFYQLVEVQGIPIRQAYEIFLQANRVIWTPTTNFTEGACGAMQAAYDLGYDVTKVSNAFATVAISLDTCDYLSFAQYVTAGETRTGVLVSAIRNPVFGLDPATFGAGANAVIDVVTEDQITVYVTSDAAGNVVVSSGPAPFSFVVSADTAYFRLSSTSDNDTPVDVTASVTP